MTADQLEWFGVGCLTVLTVVAVVNGWWLLTLLASASGLVLLWLRTGEVPR